MSKVLVIGSNSFSGASFCGWLLDQGIDVIGVSRSAQPADVMLPYRWGKKTAHFEFKTIDINVVWPTEVVQSTDYPRFEGSKPATADNARKSTLTLMYRTPPPQA